MKKITIYDKEYWIKKGYNENEAENIALQKRKETSRFCIEFWIKRGFSKNEAIEKIKQIQSENAKKRSKDSYENMLMPWEKEYWIKKNITDPDEIKKMIDGVRAKLSIDNFSEEKKNNILQKRKNTYYSKSDSERIEINKTRGKTKDQLTQKFGEERVKILSHERGKGRRNSLFRRYSKLSEKFFNDLQNNIDKKLYFGIEEKWIRYNKNKGFYVDLLYENKIIELNGNFYHANPKYYFENSIIAISKTKILTAKEIWQKDKFKIEMLQSLGYKILIIWEDDLNKFNYQNTLLKCINFIKYE